MECMLHARLGCRLWVPSPPLLWHREAGVLILRPPNLSDPVSVCARADIYMMQELADGDAQTQTDRQNEAPLSVFLNISARAQTDTGSERLGGRRMSTPASRCHDSGGDGTQSLQPNLAYGIHPILIPYPAAHAMLIYGQPTQGRPGQHVLET